MEDSQVRQNFHVESEAMINKQINLELHASYVYMSMGAYFSRDDVALPGFAKFFIESSKEERDHAQILIEYQVSRGGKVTFQDVKKPTKNQWPEGAVEAVAEALQLEKTVNASLIILHKKAAEHEDAHMTDFIEEKFLDEQVKSIKELGDLVTKLKRVGPGLGEQYLDKELQDH